MKRLISADWQLADGARDRYRIDFVRQRLPKIIEKYKPDQLLVLGDICEEKDHHPASLVNEVVGCFHDLSKLCEVIILQGNHDFLDKENPFFAFLHRFDNVTWLLEPTVRAHQDDAGVLHKVLFLPHTRNYKKDWKDIDFKGFDLILAHNIFTGVNAANGHALSGIPPSIFPKDAQVISGDVHEPQSFDCITYVGSPFTVDFGDSFEPRVLMLDGKRRVSIKVGGQQKRVITVDWDADVFHHPNTNPGDIVKFVVNLKMEHVAKWAEIRSLVEQWAHKRDYIVNSIQPVVAYVKGEGKIAAKYESKTDEQYIDSYANRLGIDKDTLSIGKKMLVELE